MSIQSLPFKFERLANQKVLISNDAGFYHLLDDMQDIIDLLAGQTENQKELKSKLFFYESDDEKNAYTQLLASAVSYRYQSALCAPFLFIIIPTLRCDHNCRYCQVSRAEMDAKGFDLNPEYIPQIIDRILEVGQAPYKIEFQGGEPLLNIGFIKEFVATFDARIGHDEREYVIATSLSLVNDSILNWAINYPITFSASLDGTFAVHDYNRRHITQSSHTLFMDNAKAIMEKLGPDRLATVSTLTAKALDAPEDIIKAHEALGLKDLFVRPLSPYGFASQKYSAGYSVEQFKVYYEQLLRLLIERYDELGMVEHNALIHLRKIFNPRFNGYVDLKSPTGHLFGALVFDYTGIIFGSDEARMLYKTHGTDALTLGHCENPMSLSNNENLVNILASSFISEMPGCDECAYQPFCGSDPMHHLSTQYDPVGDKSISRFCQYQKATFDILFRLLDEDHSYKVLKRWLNG